MKKRNPLSKLTLRILAAALLASVFAKAISGSPELAVQSNEPELSQITLALVNVSQTSVILRATAGATGAPSGFVVRSQPILNSVDQFACDESFYVVLPPYGSVDVIFGVGGCGLLCGGEYGFRARPISFYDEQWSNWVGAALEPCKP